MEKVFLLAFELWKGIDRCMGNNAVNKGCEPPGPDELKILVVNIANIALSLVATVAVIFLIIGGFQYIISAGNPDNIGQAKNTILYAIIGLILVILAFSIINFLAGRFT